MTPSGHRTVLRREIWLSELPSLLTILLQRVKYDPITQSTQKIHSPFAFDKTIFLDRYLEKNKEEVRKRRSLAAVRMQRVEDIKRQLDRLLNYQGTRLALDALLRTTVGALEPAIPGDEASADGAHESDTGDLAETAGNKLRVAKQFLLENADCAQRRIEGLPSPLVSVACLIRFV